MADQGREAAVAWAVRAVSSLRIRELSECLEKARLRKTGRKGELADRLVDELKARSQYANRTMDGRDLHALLGWIQSATVRMQQEQHRAGNYLGDMPVYIPIAPGLVMAPPLPPPPPSPIALMPGLVAGSALASAAYVLQPPYPPYVPGLGPPQLPNAARPAPAHGPAALRTPGSERNTPRGGAAGGGAGTVAQSGSGGGGMGTSLQQNPTPPGSAGAAGQRRVQCVCNSQLSRQHMVQCAGCGVWQHSDCVAAPTPAPAEAGGGGAPKHWCEMCRVERADPFWKLEAASVASLAKLQPTGRNAMVGTTMDAVQVAERSFTVPQSLLDLTRRHQTHRVLLWCLQLNDSVPFRCHWPLGCDLRINNGPYNVYGRARHNKLGANQRDEPASIGMMCRSGQSNTFKVQAVDNRQFVVLVQVASQRSVEEVKQLMKPPETLQESMARVVRQMSGSSGEDDDDIEVTHALHSLRCPLSGTRIKTPVRFVDVPGLACFDLNAFLLMVEKTKRWQCPHSMRNSCVQNLQTDTFTQKLLEGLAHLPSVTEVELSPEGKWRPASGTRGGGGGSTAPWFNAGDVPSAAAVKPEQGVGRPGSCSDNDEEEEEEEEEELRKAAEAFRQQKAAGADARKPAAPLVIDLLDSDSDEEPPATKRARLAATAAPCTRPVARLAVVAGGAAVRAPAPAPGQAPRLPFPTGLWAAAGASSAGAAAATSSTTGAAAAQQQSQQQESRPQGPAQQPSGTLMSEHLGVCSVTTPDKQGTINIMAMQPARAVASAAQAGHDRGGSTLGRLGSDAKTLGATGMQPPAQASGVLRPGAAEGVGGSPAPLYKPPGVARLRAQQQQQQRLRLPQETETIVIEID